MSEGYAEYDEYENKECMGCGITVKYLLETQGLDIDEINDDSRTTNSGLYYCHNDCLIESRR